MTNETITLIKDGGVIMALGMGFVFFFLTLTVFCINGMSFVLKKINKYFPEAIIEQQTTKKKKDDTAAIAVAIAAAKRASCK